jgi:hypothetical protein
MRCSLHGLWRAGHTGPGPGNLREFLPMILWRKQRSWRSGTRRAYRQAAISTIRAVLAVLCAVLFVNSSALAATPTQVTHRGCPSGGATGYGTFICPLPWPTVSGNWIVILLQYGVNASVAATVTDDKSDTWTVDKTFSDSNQTYKIGHIAATAGARILTLTCTGANCTFVQWASGEYNNITALHVCSAGNSGTGTAVTAGSLTPATGDLLVAIAGNESGGTSEAWTIGSAANITWGFQQNDPGYTTANMIAEAVEWGTATSTTAINANFTLAGSVAWGSVACAYTSGTAGGTDSGFYITSIEHYNLACPSGCASGTKIPIPVNGALAVLECINSSAGNGFISAISESGTGSGNTWTKIGQGTDNAGSGLKMAWYTSNASPTFGLQDVLTPTLASGTWDQADCLIYAFSQTGVLDTSITASTGTCTTGYCDNTGTQSATGNFSTLVVTPSTSSGIMLFDIGVNTPQITGTATGLSDTAYSPQEASIGELDENNGKAHNAYSSASAFTATWTQSGPVQGWRSDLFAFKTPGGATTPGFNKQRRYELLYTTSLVAKSGVDPW